MYMVIKTVSYMFSILFINLFFVSQVKAISCTTKLDGINGYNTIKHSCNISAFEAYIEKNPKKTLNIIKSYFDNRVAPCYTAVGMSKFVENNCKTPISNSNHWYKLLEDDRLLKQIKREKDRLIERAKKCSTSEEESFVIFDNCLLDKSVGKEKHLLKTIERVCKRISCNPSFLESFKYK